MRVDLNSLPVLFLLKYPSRWRENIFVDEELDKKCRLETVAEFFFEICKKFSGKQT
jgi:hypothetical protein